MTARVPLRLLAGLAACLAIASLLHLQIYTMLLPPVVPAAGVAPVVLVTIPPGASSRQIAGLLKDAGLVRSAVVFSYYARYLAVDQDLQAGTYRFAYGMTASALLEQLAAGKTYRPTVTVTIPEGFTLRQIAALLSETGVVDYEAFLDAAAKAVPQLGRQLPGQRYAVEGFLFPDTYEFEVQTPPEEVITRLQQRLAEIFDVTLRRRAQDKGLDTHQAVTLASLIEREARVPAERALISAVLHNRLRLGMPLQVDATVLYALGRHQDIVLYRDLEVASPYNTYRVTGLPPGPIASPGLAALQAALYPAEADYLYYVTRKDGSGGHYFARTLAEHEANVRRSRQNRNLNTN
jgi:UPF0755 protein